MLFDLDETEKAKQEVIEDINRHRRDYPGVPLPPIRPWYDRLYDSSLHMHRSDRPRHRSDPTSAALKTMSQFLVELITQWVEDNPGPMRYAALAHANNEIMKLEQEIQEVNLVRDELMRNVARHFTQELALED
jgi:hypothetical protein